MEYNLINRFKKIRKITRISQTIIANAMNERFGTKYTKSAICNYESGTSTSSIDRQIALLYTIGAEVQILVREPINQKFSYLTSKMEEVDKERLMKYISDVHATTAVEDLECKLYLSNYINNYIQVVPKKKGVTFLFLDKNVNGRHDYQFK